MLCSLLPPAEIWTREEPMLAMLRPLCGEGSPLLRIADGDDTELLADVFARCAADGLPLLLYGRTVSEDILQDLPPEQCRLILPRPFLLDSFAQAVQELARQTPADTLLWDGKKHTLRYGSLSVRLTPREAEIFTLLYQSMPAPVSRETLSGFFARQTSNGTDVYMKTLREKLSDFPLQIIAKRGIGYAVVRRA